MNRILLQLLVVVVLNTSAQLLLKLGADSIPSFSQVSPVSFATSIPIPLVAGILLYGFSLVLYVVTLTETNLSVAFPFLGLTYALVVLTSAFLLGEQVDTMTFVGTFLIFVGVSLVGVDVGS
ncbi:EamA-like transporter family protein [Halomicrobium zhouii]|uniref:EamA-like transporter family protein n=1 Tax=Halomicrobium zhouii TaxID=767519 RepID=A0A1I6KG62_9EURY|nr:EamA family transporter [Halomicrobium zhouii]SFR90203.1 EamA-like transporter family protein [Halomicrobium zhouii]